MNSQDRLSLCIQKIQAVVWEGFESPLYHDEAQGVFRSHFDWHSSVHAHWTLLCSARWAGDVSASARVLARLTPEAFEVERARLLRSPQFELPYGQAWLLLLLRELERHQNFTPEMRRLQSETHERISKWLEGHELTEAETYAHQSWLMSYFLYRLSKSGQQDSRAQSLREKFEARDLKEDGQDPRDFYSPRTLAALLRASPADLIAMTRPPGPGEITLQNCHQVGKFITESWTTPIQQSEALTKTLDFTESVLREPHLWRENFYLVSHWTPQFLWMGLWLALGQA